MSELAIEVMNEEREKINAYAISSLCEDGKHVIIWDFDCKPSPSNLSKIELCLNNVSFYNHLDKIIILQSRNGYNAICLNKLPFDKVYNIKAETKFDDKKHNEFGYKRLNWRLRIGNDKKIVSRISNVFKRYPSSNAHRLFLNNIYNANIIIDNTYDLTKLCLIAGYWCWKEECNNGTIKIN